MLLFLLSQAIREWVNFPNNFQFQSKQPVSEIIFDASSAHVYCAEGELERITIFHLIIIVFFYLSDAVLALGEKKKYGI